MLPGAGWNFRGSLVVSIEHVVAGESALVVGRCQCKSLCCCAQHLRQKMRTLHTGSWLGCVETGGARRGEDVTALQGRKECVPGMCTVKRRGISPG